MEKETKIKIDNLIQGKESYDCEVGEVISQYVIITKVQQVGRSYRVVGKNVKRKSVFNVEFNRMDLIAFDAFKDKMATDAYVNFPLTLSGKDVRFAEYYDEVILPMIEKSAVTDVPVGIAAFEEVLREYLHNADRPTPDSTDIEDEAIGVVKAGIAFMLTPGIYWFKASNLMTFVSKDPRFKAITSASFYNYLTFLNVDYRKTKKNIRYAEYEQQDTQPHFDTPSDTNPLIEEQGYQDGYDSESFLDVPEGYYEDLQG